MVKSRNPLKDLTEMPIVKNWNANIANFVLALPLNIN